MRKLFSMLVILFIFYIGIQLGFKYFGNGHQVDYYIEKEDNKFVINETYTNNLKGENNNYYLKITIDNLSFNFQTYHNFNKAEVIVKDIRYYQDDKYKCVLPIFKNGKVLFDFLCIGQNITTFYHNIKGQNSNLDNYINSLDLKNYKIDNWVDNKKDIVENGPVTAYTSNIVNRHYVSVSNYKGIYTINNANFKKVYSVDIFGKDIYERKISAFVDNYYVTADYEQKYDFNMLYLINVVNNKIRRIISNDVKISFDSYVQGVVGSSLYIYDRTNQKQYEIKTNTLNIVEIGNANIGVKIYKNGNWNNIKISQIAKEDIYFDLNNSETNNNYIRIDKVGNIKSGYHYYYLKDGSKYKVYRANVIDDSQKIYLFTLNSIDNIQYINDYIYFLDGNEIKYYHDNYGVRTLLKNTELTFNNNLIYHIYSKK